VLEQLLAQKKGFMKKEVDELEDELRPEYDFAAMHGGVRGKYVQRYRFAKGDATRTGTNLVLLDPDIAKAFPTDASVNKALRLLLQIASRQQSDSPVGAE
jgi:hypothetical protein